MLFLLYSTYLYLSAAIHHLHEECKSKQVVFYVDGHSYVHTTTCVIEKGGEFEGVSENR